MTDPQRHPVRAALALAGAGSLGTFLSGAVRKILISIRNHNAACAEPGASSDDPRFLHPHWGHITIDAIGGSSAGALCGSQLVKALYEPTYAGEGQELEAIATMTGDWINGGDFERLSPDDEKTAERGSIESPGWTLLSG